MDIMVSDMVRLASNSIMVISFIWSKISYLGLHCERKMSYINIMAVILTTFKSTLINFQS